MINNNTKQQTNINTGSISESSIYLKKSELPKDISSFRNDVGYISSSTLESWLKAHSYLSKNEINTLINKANLVVVDTINKTYDDDAINRLNADISDVKGEIVAIKDKLNDVETSYITIDKENTFATKSDVRTITNKVNTLSNTVSQITLNSSQYAKTSDVPTKVSELQNDLHYLTEHQSLQDYAKKSDIPDTKNLAKKSDIPSLEGYATKSWVENKGYLTEHQSLQDYAKKSQIPDIKGLAKKSDIPSLDGYATKSWVEDKKYLTEHQSLKDYAKKSQIPNISGYATQKWVQDQGYLKEVGDLSKYAEKSDLKDYVKSSVLANYLKRGSVYDKSYIDNNLLSKNEASNIYLTKTELDDEYLSKYDAALKYLTIEDYRGLKDATVISKEYQDKTLEELTSDLNILRNGFYIVDTYDMVIVKDNKIINVYKGGIQKYEWTVEEE